MRLLGWLVLGGLLLAGCQGEQEGIEADVPPKTTVESGTSEPVTPAPERKAGERIVGNWNAKTAGGMGDFLYEFKDDGTFHATMTTEGSDFLMTYDGTWSIEGDFLTVVTNKITASGTYPPQIEAKREEFEKTLKETTDLKMSFTVVFASDDEFSYQDEFDAVTTFKRVK